MGLPGPSEIERAGLKAWPGIEVEWDGAWVRRAANGYTHRANSVQSLDPSDDFNAPERLKAGRDWLVARGIEPVFRVTPLCGAGTIAALDARGWQAFDHSRVLAMELGPIVPDPRGEVMDPLAPKFLSALQVLADYSEERLGHFTALLGAVSVPARGVVLFGADGAPVAASFMDVADGIVVTGNVVTDRAQRRKGYGAAMMRTGLAWAREAGARFAALNVAADNAAGQALYRSLGYRPQYDYHYRLAAPQ